MQDLSHAALAKVRQQASVGLMGDAYFDQSFGRAMVTAVRDGLELDTAHGQLRFRPSPRFAELALDVASLSVSRPSGQSSNTVITLGESLFLKGYRRLREGINPELEMGRFLTDDVAYPNCVPVLGALEYLGHDGQAVTLAMVQSHVSNQGDGWTFTLDYLDRHLEDLRTRVALSAPSTDVEDVHGGFLSQMATLGRRTAELHLALERTTGHAAFDPEPMGDDDMAALRQRACAEVDDTMGLLRAQVHRLPQAAQAMAHELMALQPTLRKRFTDHVPVPEGSLKTRYHGDYHLGQVLVCDHDFIIIDFEGEPARSFAERRAKGSALRDVAGMLRSFSYARWSALRRIDADAQDDPRLADAALRWEQAARGAFLQAYTSTHRPAVAQHAPDDALVTLFEIEKALYELRYEINNRTDWAAVPLRGILDLLHPPPSP